MILGQTQTTALDRLNGIHRHFAEGGSAGGILWVVALIVAIVIVAALVAKFAAHLRQRRSENPRVLFLDLLEEVPLSVAQRELLRKIAAFDRLPNPAVILLSRPAFVRSAERWLSRRTNIQLEEEIKELQRVLFDNPHADLSRRSDGVAAHSS